MDAERWAQIKTIFSAAAGRPADERAAFIRSECNGDESLAVEVESLLAAHERAGSFIEALPTGEATAALEDPQIDPLIGQQIGPYKVIKLLGRGGMGEVYLARDSRLGRQVALKLLPAQFTALGERVRRFEQEARSASSLNHPNIITLHDIGEIEGRHHLVTEYVEGETLRRRMESAPQQTINLNEALEIATQVATALAAAHDAGIVHRDIKPENIMLRPDGLVKVLDFGLAKLTEPSAQAIMAGATTESGVVMGTPRYMSPEQARGQAVDGRTDIFSLAVVLYEMIAGSAPFAGDSGADVIAAILVKEPLPLANNLPGVPGELERIVSKALRKEREDRYQTIKELLADLKDLKRDLERGADFEAARKPEDRSRRRAMWKGWKLKSVLAIVAIAALAFAWYWLSRPGTGSKEAPPRNATFTQLTDQAGPEYFPSLSPDGKSFVYASQASGNWDIYFQRVGGKTSINLTKDSPVDDTHPAFSPDGERIAFRSEREGGGIFLMGATGESVKRLTDFGFNPAWSPDGKEIACADEGPLNPAGRATPISRVWAVNVATGERRQVTDIDSIQPSWSPHGVRIAYGGKRKSQPDIWTIPAGGGEPVEVTNDPAVEGSPVWSPDGKYLYFASDRAGSMNLWRVPIEEQTGRVIGPPEAVTTPSPYSAQLSFSLDGRRMVYSQIVRRINLQQVGFDPRKEKVTGQPVWITQGSRSANTPHLSPDDEWLVFDSQLGKQEDLFVIRRDGTGLRQLTDDPYLDRQPRWSPDGMRIAFFSDRSGKWEIWIINSDGSGLKQLTYAPYAITQVVWSPDGTRIVSRNGSGSPVIIEVEKPWTEQSPQVLPSRSDFDWAWSWSADGRKLALKSGTRDGVVVYYFESQQYEQLTDFGTNPVWLSDSRRILFNGRGTGKLYLVDSESKKVHEVLSVAPHDVRGGVTLSRDDRLIYFSPVTTEADIWLMSLE